MTARREPIPDPCPLSSDLQDMAARAGEILARDPAVELLALETELEHRYGFTRAQIEAGAARAVALARRARIERAVAAEERRAARLTLVTP